MNRRDLVTRAAALIAAGACAPTIGTAPPAPAASPPAGTSGAERAIPAKPQPAWLLTGPARSRMRALFTADPRAALPRLRIADREWPLEQQQQGLLWAADVDARGLTAGTVDVQVIERVQGSDLVVASIAASVSAPVYVAWTLDHEGYDEPDDRAANVSATAEGLAIPLTILFHPRVLLAGSVSDARRDAILRWVAQRAARGDEIGMHLHMQLDFVRAAGVEPRVTPRWGVGVDGDGYDVPMTAYTEDEQRQLLRFGVERMVAAGLPRPTSFRAGGLFADARTLRAVAAEGFTADTSSREAATTGALRVPWTLDLLASPYRPNRDDANRQDAPTLPLLEVPTTAGNTYSDNLAELARRQRAIWPGGVVGSARVLDYVSHPSTYHAAERATVERVFGPLASARADRDAGPVRFVRLRELVGLWP